MARDIGIDVAAPSGTCSDAKCPFHGTLPVRGKIFKGTVVSALARNTATVRWSYFKYFPKYERYARGNTKVSVHNPTCIGAASGDIVRIAECRPLSKTKRFVIIEKVAKEKPELVVDDKKTKKTKKKKGEEE